MADAPLDDIESALFAALRALHAAPTTEAAPFRLVERWSGQVSHETGVDEATLGRAPACLLAFESSTPELVARTSDNQFMTVETHLFRVYVVVEDARGDEKAIKGTVHRPGILRCAQRVKEALAGLRIPALYDGGTVELVGHKPWLVEGGVQHTHVVWVSARAGLPESLPTVPGVPLVVRGEITDATPDTDSPSAPAPPVRVAVSTFSLD